MDSVVYNIPVSMVKRFQGRNLIVRSQYPAEIVEGLAKEDLARVLCVQVLSIGSDLQPLTYWGQGIPMDLVVQDTATDLPFLYNCSPLLAEHPVRVTIPVAPGFSRMVKLAVSLNFPVKLEVSQPDRPLLGELSQVVHMYLRQATVTQPVECFHSLFMAFCWGNPVSLWAIQEEDTSHHRYVTDAGQETLSKRFAGVDLKGGIASFKKEFRDELIGGEGECRSCSFLENCGCYFKWPNRHYPCDGVKYLFQTLKNAAEELRADLATLAAPGGEDQL